MFSGAQNLMFTGGSFVEQNNGMTGMQLLYHSMTQGATHDSGERFPPAKCHPDTRKAIVREIMAWITDVDRKEDVLWVNGPAGVGKSAIAQTLAELCQAAGQLGGSFFFSRTAPGRDHSRRLFATIAYQLSLVIPELGQLVDKIVAHDPSIVDKSPAIQLQKLIVEPIQSLCLNVLPTVVVIDGLDECLDESAQCHILQLIGSVFIDTRFPICFVVTSRPEPWIRDEVNLGQLSRVVRHLALEQTPDVDRDIHTLFRAGFLDILTSSKHRHTMSHATQPWPSDSVVDDLVFRASGQFIYAATVLKFVGDPHYRPIDRLRIVVETPTSTRSASNPFADLDSLYIQILSTSHDKTRTLDVLGTVLTMLTSSSDLYLEWAPHLDLLNIAEKLVDLDPGEAHLALRTIHSLVHIHEPDTLSAADNSEPLPPEDIQDYASDEPAVRFYHKSFSDFLCDATRSGTYFVDLSAIHLRITLACFQIMTNGLLQAPKRISYLAWGYATLHWTYHCKRSALSNEIIIALKLFDLFYGYIMTLDHKLTGGELHYIRKSMSPPKSKLFRLLRIKERISTDTMPNPNALSPEGMNAARKFMLSLGAQNDFVAWGYSRHLQAVAEWLKTAPDPPALLIAKLESASGSLREVSRRTRTANRIMKSSPIRVKT
ncbi:hypothetical protein B0H34DRAFT_801408 [Crassisporium funariophilum]|nr:hypothetical protein B0H34DRAFT_801408 [Crassisporium funariophilum]